MQNNGESLWNEVKPVFMIVGAIIIWVISFILFIVGLRFNQALMVWGRDLTIPVSAGIATVITIVEMSLVDSVLDDEKDWILIGIGIACYILGITVGYLALMSLLSLADPRLQKVVSITLAFIFEVGPERLLLAGLRRLNISFNLRGLFNSFGRPKSGKNQQRQRQQQIEAQQRQQQIAAQQRQAQQQAQQQRYTVPAHLQQSSRTPLVPRPGNNRAHTIGSLGTLDDSDIQEEQE